MNAASSNAAGSPQETRLERGAQAEAGAGRSALGRGGEGRPGRRARAAGLGRRPPRHDPDPGLPAARGRPGRAPSRRDRHGHRGPHQVPGAEPRLASRGGGGGRRAAPAGRGRCGAQGRRDPARGGADGAPGQPQPGAGASRRAAGRRVPGAEGAGGRGGRDPGRRRGARPGLRAGGAGDQPGGDPLLPERRLPRDDEGCGAAADRDGRPPAAPYPGRGRLAAGTRVGGPRPPSCRAAWSSSWPVRPASWRSGSTRPACRCRAGWAGSPAG